MRAPPLAEPRVRASLGGALRFWGSDRLPFGIGPVPPTRGFKPRALMLGYSRFRRRPALAGPPSGRSLGRSVTLPVRMRVASRREAFPNRSRHAGHRSPASGCRTASPDIRTAIAPDIRQPVIRQTIGLRTGKDDAPCLRRRHVFERSSLSCQSAGTMRRIWTANHDPNIRFPIGRLPVTTSPMGVREATGIPAMIGRWRRRKTRAQPVKCGT